MVFLINIVLGKANGILGQDYKPFDEFETFSEDDMPSNSDVVLMLSHYLRSTDKLRQNNTEPYMGASYWVISGERSGRRAKKPLVFRD